MSKSARFLTKVNDASFHLPTLLERLDFLETQIEDLSKKVSRIDTFTTGIHLELQTSINRVANQVSELQSNGPNQINELWGAIADLQKTVAFLLSK